MKKEHGSNLGNRHVTLDSQGRAKNYYNPTRDLFVTKDRQRVCRWYEDDKGERQFLEICQVGEKKVTEEDIENLIALLQEEDASYFKFRHITKKYNVVEGVDFDKETSLTARMKSQDPEVFYMAFPEYQQTLNPYALKVREKAHQILSGRQLYLFIQHVECGRSLKDINAELNAHLEKPISDSALSNAWSKITDKLCKAFGEQRKTIRNKK